MGKDDGQDAYWLAIHCLAQFSTSYSAARIAHRDAIDVAGTRGGGIGLTAPPPSSLTKTGEQRLIITS